MDLIYLHAMENPSKYQTLCELIQKLVNDLFSKTTYHITELIEVCYQLNKTRLVIELMFHSTNEIIKWNISHGDDLLSIEQLFDHYIITNLQRLSIVQDYNLKQVDELFCHLHELSNYVIHSVNIPSLLANINQGDDILDAVKMLSRWLIYEKEDYLLYLKLDPEWYIQHGYHQDNFKYARLLLCCPDEVIARIIDYHKRTMSFNQLCNTFELCYITDQITDDMLCDRIDEPMSKLLITQRSTIHNYKDRLKVKLLNWDINEKAEHLIVSHISDTECSVLLNEYCKRMDYYHEGMSVSLICYNISLWSEMITSYRDNQFMNNELVSKLIKKPNVRMTYLGKVIIFDHLTKLQISCSDDVALVLLMFNDRPRINSEMIRECIHRDVHHKTITTMLGHGWIIKQGDHFALGNVCGKCHTNLRRDQTVKQQSSHQIDNDDSKKCQLVRIMKKFSTKWFTVQELSSIIDHDVSKMLNNLLDVCLVQERNGKYKYLP